MGSCSGGAGSGIADVIIVIIDVVVVLHIAAVVQHGREINIGCGSHQAWARMGFGVVCQDLAAVLGYTPLDTPLLAGA